MIQAMNSPPCTAKAAEIMSRYRPIAPRPEPTTDPTPILSPTDPNSPENSTTTHSDHLPQNIRQSPYLMNVWPHLQARPTRTRKRGRTAMAPSLAKRPRGHLVPLAPALFPLQANGFPGRTLHQFQLAALPGLVSIHNHNMNHHQYSNSSNNLVTLPLLPSIPILPDRWGPPGIDLNREAQHHEIPEEKDFLQQLQGKVISNSPGVFAPQAVRPVCSSICVGPMSVQELDLSLSSTCSAQIRKRKRKEVEEEMESESVPAVVSDSKNKVRLANSAYMEMVGQPECSWLESTSCACKRICGEVMLHFCESSCDQLPVSSNGFSCWVTIEWGGGRDGKACSVNAFCDVVKLSCCDTQDYLYAWRFHTASSSTSTLSTTSTT